MDKIPEVAFYTLGCKLNFAETSTIERLFAGRGFQKVGFGSRTADIVVINTCTVTASAEKKCRNIINKAVRTSPGAFVAVVGCYSQLKADNIARIPGVDIVLGSKEKFKIFEYAGDFSKNREPLVHVGQIIHEESFSPSYSLADRTRSFLKIQDGCDYFCSYCTIPLARGRSRSAKVDDILMQAKRIEQSGVKEIVLTGVNIGDFGKPGSGGLAELLKKLEQHTNIDRIRLSSIEPDLLSDRIINFVAGSQRFAPHFHLPLQSGCDRILEKMNRRYLTLLFTDRIKKIRSEIPDAGVGADVITGFPGESDADFNETYTFVKNSDIAFLHVFTYSERNNTRAARLPGKVPPEKKESRSKLLHALADEKLKVFHEKNVGKVHKVLFEAYNKKGRMYGFTGNYIKVEAPADEKAINRLMDAELIAVGENGVMKGLVRM
ncbi:MAG: tRNA (N(6)-L-threonylcarbamoyladenosine(37)-C(2))-methylthiotransferase MtaB [Bacteroidales bacterium]